MLLRLSIKIAFNFAKSLFFKAKTVAVISTTIMALKKNSDILRFGKFKRLYAKVFNILKNHLHTFLDIPKACFQKLV